MLTGLVRHASPVVAAAFPSARKCASSTANIRKHSRLLFSTSAINNSYEYGRSMSYMLLGSLAAASLYYLTGSEAGKAKADGETEEPVAVAKSPAVLTGLQKSTAYIVGDGVLTGKTDTDPMIVPHQIVLDRKVKEVAIGEGEVFAIDEKGALLTWTAKSKPTTPTSVSSYAFKQVYCGSNGMVALLQTNGSVWIRFSATENFQLINKGDLRKKTVVKIAVGAQHVAALTSDGLLYTLGQNDRGQCGITELKQSPKDVPHQVAWAQKFEDVGAGLHHTVAVTSTGQVVAFGFNKNLQLGKPQEWVQYDPPSIPIVPFGSYREVRESEQKRFHARSWNDMNEYVSQYAHSNPAIVDYFLSNHIVAKRVICGDEFTLVVDAKGDIYGFGDGAKGQLARNPARAFVPPTRIHRPPFFAGKASDFDTLTCGSSHCMAFNSKTGDLWTWGSNVQGACARQNKVFTPVPTKLAIQNDSPIQKVICTKDASVIIL